MLFERSCENLILDPYQVAGPYFVEKGDQFQIVHVDTAARNGSSEPVFVIGAVNVNVAFVGIDIATRIHSGLKAPKAENARHDQIPGVFLFVEFTVVFPDIHAPFEHRSRRRAGANPIANFV